LKTPFYHLLSWILWYQFSQAEFFGSKYQDEEMELAVKMFAPWRS
jgi:hypothetical protein